MGDREHNWWACQECGWDPEDSLGDVCYQVKKGRVYILKQKKEDNNWFPIKKYKKLPVYPKITEYHDYYNQSWKETHFCPNCNEEFDFSNGT